MLDLPRKIPEERRKYLTMMALIVATEALCRLPDEYRPKDDIEDMTEMLGEKPLGGVGTLFEDAERWLDILVGDKEAEYEANPKSP